MELTPHEKTLYALLTVEIARCVGGQKGVPYWSASLDSCYEWGAWILRELGFASLSQSDGTPVPEGKTGPHYHLQHCSSDEITQSFTDGKVDFDVPLQKLLSVYIELTGYFDSAIGKLPAGIRPFIAPDYYRQIMPALVKSGYAVKLNSTKYAWTDKIGPAFHESGEWSAATLSKTRVLRDKKPIKESNAAAEMLDTMPRRIKKKLYRASSAHFSKIIAEFWYDDKWNFKERQKPKDYAAQNSELTMQLIQRIEEEGGIG
jgi:hypothetical protein